MLVRCQSRDPSEDHPEAHQPKRAPAQMLRVLRPENRRQTQMQRRRLVEGHVKTGKGIEHPTEQPGRVRAIEGKPQRKKKES